MNARILFSVCALMLIVTILVSCKDDDDDEPKEEIKLGGTYKGGIIFYIDGTGVHGLIAATSDQSTTDPWSNGTFVTTGATSTSNGSANTTSIIQAQGNSGNYAARNCRNYNSGGFNDWYLPSKDELNLLYTQKALVSGLGGSLYWSSTEQEIASAWVQDFSDGLQHTDNTSDGASVHARAIRSF